MRTFADACRALVDAPGPDHSLYTTLAPLYDALADDDRFRRQFRLARERLPPGTASVLEVGCGVGGLLPLLAGAYDDVVGVDRSTAVLAAAACRTDVPLVAADVGAGGAGGTRPDADGTGIDGRATDGTRTDGASTAADRAFDAVVAFGVLGEATTDARLRGLCRTLRAHLRPGGTVVCDAVTDPDALREAAVSVYRDEGFRLERAVEVVPARDGGRVEVVTDYRATDLATGETGTATERRRVRTFDADGLRAALTDAGLVDAVAEPSPRGADAGRLVAAATRPVETSE